MSISSSGVLTWASPVAGAYVVTVSAKDPKTGLSGSGAIKLNIAAATASSLTITAPAATGKSGVAFSTPIKLADGKAGAQISIAISGVPVGMGFVISGSTVYANWTNPVAGSYALSISAKDNYGQSATASMPITISK